MFTVLIFITGVRIIRQHILAEAQTRVCINLSSAWALFNNCQQELEKIIKLVALKEIIVDVCAKKDWDNINARSRLQKIYREFGLDFIGLIDVNGCVGMRGAPPYKAGDFILNNPAITKALHTGEENACVALMSAEELANEANGLVHKAFFEIEQTPHSRKTPKNEESRGMVFIAAVPVKNGPNIVGVAYGGILLNRNNKLVDRVTQVVFKGEEKNGVPLGTATIFLDDVRIATTVRMANGNRAIGTRVSKEVADRVLDNGLAWVGEAFVVNDRYLTAYEPIKDGFGNIVGMLYVGMLKKPFDDLFEEILAKFAYVSLFVLVVALGIAFFTAGKIAYPIHRLVEAVNVMSDGKYPEPIPLMGSCKETDSLINAFNQMTSALIEREKKLKALNKSYMETLSFVTHELKGPVATMMNYVYLLREEKLGTINEKQAKAIKAIDASGQRLIEMVRHYLNLSRIEKGEYNPVLKNVSILNDVLSPLLIIFEKEIADALMHIENKITADIIVNADINMIREVFENLIGNAIKYGRNNGRIVLDARKDEHFIRFSVWNEGMGIHPDKIGQLFKKFSRVHDDDRSIKKGTGLGLFITKHIIENHGGKIEVKSEYGKWAEFIFTLPSATVGEK